MECTFCKGKFEEPGLIQAQDFFTDIITGVGVNILVVNKDNKTANRFWGPMRDDKLMACPRCGRVHLYGFGEHKYKNAGA